LVVLRSWLRLPRQVDVRADRRVASEAAYSSS
jgi:hypothetical protein